MPLTRFKLSSIADGGISTAKLADGAVTLAKTDSLFVNTEISGTSHMKVPVGTTAQRPSTAYDGYLRFNTDFDKLEQYSAESGTWSAIDTPPSIISLSYPGSLTAVDPAGGETITLSGTNFQNGAIVSIDGTNCTTTVIDSTSITFVTTAKAAGDYDVVVTNSNGLTASLTNGISYNGVPAFTSPAAGKIGNSLVGGKQIPTITIVAAEPDSGTVAYSITSGSLPVGLSLNGSSGEITGTAPIPSGETTYPFTVTATDDENQSTDRNYNLVVLRPVYNRVLEHSVRFYSSQQNYFYRNNSGMTAGGEPRFTVSAWVKRDNDTSKDIFLIGSETGTNARFIVYANGQNLRVFGRNSSNATQFDYVANNVLKDSTAWYHVMIAFDSPNATPNDRIRFYVNGTRVPQSNININTAITQNYGSNGNAQQEFYIGRDAGTYAEGYLADYHYIYGIAKTDPYEFIADYRGAIIPKVYTGSYGTYGFNLDFEDDALTSTGLGDDNSGNGNDYTPNNFATNSGIGAGLTNDVVTDTPTSNHTTLMDFSHNGATINRGMLRSIKPSSRYFAAANTGINSGKWYWEMYSTDYGDGGGVVFGIIPVAEMGRADADLADLHSWGFLSGRIISGAQSYYYISGGSQTYFGDSSSFTATDTVGFSMDFDNHEFKVYDTTDASVLLTIDTSSITNVNDGDGQWPWSLVAGGNETGGGNKVIHWNFGQDDFRISGGIPSGFSTIKESNRDEPTLSPLTSVSHVGGAFEAKTYSGDGNATKAITGVGFQPDLIISKKYDTTYNWSVYDSVRGPNKRLNTNTNNFQTTEGLDSFDTDGFTINNSGSLNASGDYVAYCWKAGGAPTAANVATSGAMTANSVSLNGTLQSAYTPSGSPTVYPHKMSINTEAGFSIVEYNTGSNGDTYTVPHGLGAKPKVIWHKGGYDGNTFNWDVYNQWTPTSGANYNGHLGRLKLNSPDGFENNTGDVPWGDTPPTSDVITFSNSSSSSADWYGLNKNNIAYIWTDVPGFSDFGFYRGNGNTTGPYIYVGFKPRIVIIKNVSSGSTFWTTYDSAREDEYNMYRRNALNDQAAATGIASNTSAKIDILSNGFRLTGGGGSYVNTDGDAYIYMAFAEMPGQYSLGLENTGD
jgi:hypothetical protein